jgi:hypothetical protein
MSNILNLIKQTGEPEHQVHVNNYNNFGQHELTIGTCFCPYCLAVSLWFNRVISYPLNVSHEYIDHGYNFFVDGYHQLPFPEPMVNIYINNNAYFLEDDYQIWSYEVQLKQLFISLLVCIIPLFKDPDLANRISSFSILGFEKIYRLRPIQYAYNLNQKHSILKVSEPKLESVILELLENLQSNNNRCEEFHQYLYDNHKRPEHVKAEPNLLISMNQLKLLEFGAYKIKLNEKPWLIAY